MNTELRKLAEAATPGPWQVINGHYPGFREIEGPSFRVSIVMSATNLTFSDGTQRETDAGFIAAANPQAILELLDKIDQLQASNTNLLETARALREDRDAKNKALLNIARMAEDLKQECGQDPESQQAIRNGQYMNISYAARAAMKEQP